MKDQNTAKVVQIKPNSRRVLGRLPKRWMDPTRPENQRKINRVENHREIFQHKKKKFSKAFFFLEKNP